MHIVWWKRERRPGRGFVSTMSNVGIARVRTHDGTFEFVFAVADHFFEAEEVVAFPACFFCGTTRAVVVYDFIEHLRYLEPDAEWTRSLFRVGGKLA
jgi:hypothetical protein